VKLFVTASDAVRAQRRHAELAEKDGELSLAAVLADLQARDARDMQRADAPLKPADDAVVLDTSRLSIDEAVEKAIALATSRMAARNFTRHSPH
jgi:cytidylate kinase